MGMGSGMKTKGWMSGLLALATTATAQADGQISPLLEPMSVGDEPRTGALALVGMGLMVLSVFARKRDP